MCVSQEPCPTCPSFVSPQGLGRKPPERARSDGDFVLTTQCHCECWASLRGGHLWERGVGGILLVSYHLCPPHPHICDPRRGRGQVSASGNGPAFLTRLPWLVTPDPSSPSPWTLRTPAGSFPPPVLWSPAHTLLHSEPPVLAAAGASLWLLPGLRFPLEGRVPVSQAPTYSHGSAHGTWLTRSALDLFISMEMQLMQFT